MSEVVTREMTLREKAQRWLDSYKENDSISSDVYVSIKEWAIIVAVFLNETDPDKTEDDATSERIKVLQDELSKTKQMLEGERMTHESLVYDLARARAKVEAYEFVIRCNSMSGAEVRP